MHLFSKFLPPPKSFKFLLIATFLPLLVACGGSSDSPTPTPPDDPSKDIVNPLKNISLTANSTSQITVSWTSNGASSYEIYRHKSNSTAGLTVVATTTNVSYKDTALTADTKYYYWVKACKENSKGEKTCSDFSPVASKATFALTPIFPTTFSLTIKVDSTSQLTVSWVSVSGAEYYEIYRNKSDSNAGLTAAIATTTNISYKDKGLTADMTYYYWVKACKENLDGLQACSDFSKVASKTTWDFIPSVPAGVSLSADSSSQITVSWNNVDGAEYYELYRNTSNTNTALTAIDSPLASSGTTYTYTDSGLSPNTTYYYWLKACKTGNNCSVFSEIASTKTQGESIYSWSRAASVRASLDRSGHSSVVLNNRLYIIGGYTPRLEVKDRIRNDVWSSTDGITWTIATDSAAFSKRTEHQSVVFDDGTGEKMWVISGSFKNDVWNSTDGVTWTPVTDSAAFPYRSYHTAVVFKDAMWVIGGYTGSGQYANDVWNSIDGVTWTTATDSAQFPARSHHTTVVFKDQIWVIGGIDSSDVIDGNEQPYSPKNDVWRSTNGITWTTATDSAQFPARGGHTSVVFDNKIWVIGGQTGGVDGKGDGQRIQTNDVWSSTDGITWTKMDNPGFAVRDNHESAVFNNRVWVIGGFVQEDAWYMVKE